ncbi:MAG: hypothetical protein ACE5KV_00970 [Thermoplasmata archaeon]
MSIKEFLKRISESRWGFLFYLVIIIPLSVLFYVLGTCLFIFFVVFASMAVPYYLGMREPRKFAILGFFILILNSLSFGAISTQRAYDYSNYYASYAPMNALVAPQESSFLNLSEGKVTPTIGDADTEFRFTVLYRNEYGIPPNYVSVVVSDSLRAGLGREVPYIMDPINASDADYVHGVLYEVRTTLPNRMDPRYIELPNHYFSFVAEDGNQSLLNTTLFMNGQYFYGYGPMNAPVMDAFLPNLAWGFANMLWTISLFYLVVLMYWWLGRARERSEMWRQRMEAMQKEEEAEFECDRCGSDVPADAERCPRCGAVFEEEMDEGEE